jgi:hypothetical protein
MFDERDFPGTAIPKEDIPDLLPDWDEPVVELQELDNAPIVPPIMVAGHPVHHPPPVPLVPAPNPPAPAPAPAPVVAQLPAGPANRELRQLRAHFETFPNAVPAVRRSGARQPGIHREPDTDEDEEDEHANLGEVLPDPIKHPFQPLFP